MHTTPMLAESLLASRLKIFPIVFGCPTQRCWECTKRQEGTGLKQSIVEHGDLIFRVRAVQCINSNKNVQWTRERLFVLLWCLFFLAAAVYLAFCLPYQNNVINLYSSTVPGGECAKYGERYGARTHKLLKNDPSHLTCTVDVPCHAQHHRSLGKNSLPCYLL